MDLLYNAFTQPVVATVGHAAPLSAASVFSMYTFFCVASKTRLGESQRARAWTLCLVVATAMTAASLPYLLRAYSSGFYLPSLGQNTPVSAFCLVFYMSFCLLDMCLGYTKYGKHMNTLSYIHHSFYTFVTAYLLLVKQCGDQFMLMMVFEIPTILLALGHVSNDTIRNDWLFGVLFFFSRIVYHFFITAVFIYHLGFDSRTLLVMASIPMHVYWFYGWYQSMFRKTASRRNSIAAAPEPPVKLRVSPASSPVLGSGRSRNPSPRSSPKFALPRVAPIA